MLKIISSFTYFQPPAHLPDVSGTLKCQGFPSQSLRKHPILQKSGSNRFLDTTNANNSCELISSAFLWFISFFKNQGYKNRLKIEINDCVHLYSSYLVLQKCCHLLLCKNEAMQKETDWACYMGKSHLFIIWFTEVLEITILTLLKIHCNSFMRKRKD